MFTLGFLCISFFFSSAKRASFSYSSSSYTLFGQPMLVAVPRKHTTYHDLYDIIMKKMR